MIRRLLCRLGFHKIHRTSYESEGRYVSALIVQDVCKHCRHIQAGLAIPYKY